MNSITNVQVFGLEESMIASMYPFSTDVTDVADTDRVIDRARSLGRAKLGSGHSNYCKGIVVQFDWNNSLLIQRQVLRYNFIDIISSQSTMHRVLQMDVTSQVSKYVDPAIVQRCKEMINEYHYYRDRECLSDEQMRELEIRILHSIPSGYCLTARYTTNYLQLKTMYTQRRHHKLPEWQEFCDWCESLPMFKTLTGIKGEE